MIISLIVPVLNEEAAIPIFYDTVRKHPALCQYSIEIVFINDGSTDSTQKVIEQLAANDPLVAFMEFSRNFGKEPALFAGLEQATGDAVIPIDVDLQDPIEVIPQLLAAWQQGAEVVLAKRRCRKTDSFAKRKSAEIFYWLHNKIADFPIEPNVGDFRLLDRKIVEHIKTLPERKLFMKGVFSWVGFTEAIVLYDRAERVAGNTKFHGWKLWNLALEGITSFSTLPLRVWTYLGSGIALCSFAFAFWLILDKLFFDNPVPGYPSLMAAILFLGGVQLIGIGVLGEYVGRIYMETKRRPRYIARKMHPGTVVPPQHAGNDNSETDYSQ